MADEKEKDGGGNGGKKGDLKKNVSPLPTLLFLGIFFLPSLIITGIIYLLLRSVRLHPRLIGGIVLALEIIAVLVWFFGDAQNLFMNWLGDLKNWQLLLPSIFAINTAIGGIVGYGLVLWEVRQMKINPHTVKIPGSWAYQFKYRRTPSELRKKKEIITDLRNGALISEKRSPLGICEEEKYCPVYRYTTESFKHTLIVGAAGSGKALHKDTNIPTPSGTKKVGDLKKGDEIFDEQGKKTNIVAKYQPMTDDHYMVVFSDGTEIKACGDHLWSVNDLFTDKLTRKSLSYFVDDNYYQIIENEILNRKINVRSSAEKIISTREMFETYNVRGRKRYKVINTLAVDYPKKDLPIDPYTFGAWLGDSHGTMCEIFGIDEEIRDVISAKYKLIKTRIVEKESKKDLYYWTFDGLYEQLKSLGCIINKKTPVYKFIPEDYLCSSIEQRIELLSGLLDADGYCDNDGIIELAMTNKQIVESARKIVSSLGYTASKIKEKTKSYKDNEGNIILCKQVYSFKFVSDKQLFKVNRKSQRLSRRLNKDLSQQIKHTSRYISKIIKIEDNPADYFCFTVDSPNSLFLCSDSYIPTHNTKTMMSLIRSDICNGTPVVVIDMKRSPEFASMMAKWAEDEEGSFYHFVNGDPESYDVPNSPGQACYEPLRSGSVTSKADMILGMREFDTASEIYKQNMNQLLQVLFAMLKYANPNHESLKMTGFFDKKGRRVYDTAEFVERAEVKIILDKERDKFEKDNGKNNRNPFNPISRLKDLGILETKDVPRIDWNHGGVYQLATAVSGNNLEYLCQACVGTPIESEAREIAQLLDKKLVAGSGIRNAVSELQGQMRTIIASEYGRWLKTAYDGEQSIDLFKLTKTPGSVILFSLNSDAEPEFARYIGSLIMADITNVSAKRRNKQLQNPVNVYIDEFQALVPNSVASLLEKSRESRLAMTLAQQSFEQIIKSSPNNGEAYLLSVLDTCSNFIVHAGMQEDSAERVSKLLGKEFVDVYRVTNKHEGFFLKNNANNRKNQTVQVSKEEQWKFPPERFLTLTAPDPSNNFKTTAVIVNKTSSDPKYKNHAGAVAREVWMIPPDEVLDKYYQPKFDDESGTQGMIADIDDDSPIGELLLDVEGKKTLELKKRDIYDNEDNYEYENSFVNTPPGEEDYNYYDEVDDEEEDGGFDFEEISDEDEEESMLVFDKPKPETKPSPSRLTRVPSSSTSNRVQHPNVLLEPGKPVPVEELFGGSSKYGRRTVDTSSTHPEESKKYTSRKKVDDDFALPDLGEDFDGELPPID